MAKYNKNLYNHIVSGHSGRAYGTFVSFLKYVAYAYMLGVVLMSIIGLTNRYFHDIDKANIEFLLHGAIWLIVVFVIGIVGVVISATRKGSMGKATTPFSLIAEALCVLISSLANIYVASPIGVLALNSSKSYLYMHLLPSLILLLLCAYCFVSEMVRYFIIRKKYNAHYNALYRWASEKYDKVLDIDEFEKVLDEYNGAPIKKEYFEK